MILFLIQPYAYLTLFYWYLYDKRGNIVELDDVASILRKAVVQEPGVQAHPQKFWFDDIRTKPWKFGRNQGNLCKFCENLHKIPENLGELPKITTKNGAQHALIWENSAQNHMKTFFWRSSKLRSSCNAQKMTNNFFGQIWRKSGKNPSHPQKCACSYTYEAQINFYCFNLHDIFSWTLFLTAICRGRGHCACNLVRTQLEVHARMHAWAHAISSQEPTQNDAYRQSFVQGDAEVVSAAPSPWRCSDRKTGQDDRISRLFASLMSERTWETFSAVFFAPCTRQESGVVNLQGRDQRWPRIRSPGVDSSRILHKYKHCWFSVASIVAGVWKGVWFSN